MHIERFAIDRIEGDVAVVVGDDGADHLVPFGALPSAAQEGSVLEITVDTDGLPDWTTARIDAQATHRRLVEARARLERLRKRK